jgi:hypothetical protein
MARVIVHRLDGLCRGAGIGPDGPGLSATLA